MRLKVLEYLLKRFQNNTGNCHCSWVSNTTGWLGPTDKDTIDVIPTCFPKSLQSSTFHVHSLPLFVCFCHNARYAVCTVENYESLPSAIYKYMNRGTQNCLHFFTFLTLITVPINTVQMIVLWRTISINLMSIINEIYTSRSQKPSVIGR